VLALKAFVLYKPAKAATGINVNVYAPPLHQLPHYPELTTFQRYAVQQEVDIIF